MTSRADAAHTSPRPAFHCWNGLRRDGIMSSHQPLWPKHSTQLQLLSNAFPDGYIRSGHLNFTACASHFCRNTHPTELDRTPQRHSI
jgi:hypothetical protein